MAYYLDKILDTGFDEAIERVKARLKDQGFGIVTEIDMQATLKTKIGADIRPYKILGACNPAFANQALAIEDRIGVLLPCNVLVQELSRGRIAVSTINPAETMSRVGKPALEPLAAEVTARLSAMLAAL